MVGRRRLCLYPSRGTDECRAAWSRERTQKHCDDVRDHPCGAGHVPCLQNKMRRRKLSCVNSIVLRKQSIRLLAGASSRAAGSWQGSGCSIFQMLLLAQAWSLNQQAFVPACLASAWVLGAVMGMRLRADARLLGSCVVLCALLWLESTRLVSWQMTTTAHAVGAPVYTRSVGATSGNDQFGLACPAAALVTCR